MSERKPGPIHTTPTRTLCPVCGKPSYSLNGVHPQCAVAQADAITRAARKAASQDTKNTPGRSSWSKTCPKCKRRNPPRRFICDCGHQFGTTPAGGTKSAAAAGSKSSENKSN